MISPFLPARDADTIVLDFGVFVALQARTYRVSQSAIIAAINQQPSASRPKAAAASTPPVGAQAEEVVAPVSSAEPIQPETATKSTDVSQKRAQTATGTGTSGDNLGSDSRPMATAKTDVPSDQSQASGDGRSQDSSGVRVASVEPPPKRITQRQRVRECHEAHPDWTSSQIAAHLDMGVQHVRVIAGHISLKLPKDARQPKASLQDRVIAAYEAHPEFTNRQIADLVGCSYSTVSSWLSARRKAVAAPSAPAAPEAPPAVTAAPPIAEPPPAKAPAPIAPPRPAPERDATDELHIIRRPSSSVRFYVRDQAGRYLHQSLERSPTDTGPLMTTNRSYAWFDNAQRYRGALKLWPEIATMRKEGPQS